jgi:hypothetical protein
MLCMAGTLTSLGKTYSRLWSSDFDDAFFFSGLQSWLSTGQIKHDTSYLVPVGASHPASATPAWAMGQQVGNYVLRTRKSLACLTAFAWA